MAFPTTSILDDFTRSNGALGSNWGAPIFTTENTPTVFSNAMVGVSSVWNSAYWSAATYLNSEVFATINGDVGNTFFARINSPNSANVDCYWMQVRIDNDTLDVQRIVDGSTSVSLYSGSQTVVSGDVWGMRVTNQGSDIVIRIYRNGTLIQSLVDTDAVTTYSTTLATPGYIGCGLYGDGDALTRYIDNFGGGTTELSPYETIILSHGPAVYYRMDDTSGLIQDSSGFGRHATRSRGSLTYNQSGPFSGAKSILVSSGGFATAQASWMDFGDGPFTLEAWMKPVNIAQNNWVIDRGGNGSIGGYRIFMRNDNPDKLVCGEATVNDVFVSTQPYDIFGTWFHIVWTKNGSDTNTYVNGIKIAGTVANSTLDNFTDDLYIADVYTETGTSNAYYSEIALYNKVLSLGQIQAHFEAGPGLEVTSKGTARQGLGVVS